MILTKVVCINVYKFQEENLQTKHIKILQFIFKTHKQNMLDLVIYD